MSEKVDSCCNSHVYITNILLIFVPMYVHYESIRIRQLLTLNVKGNSILWTKGRHAWLRSHLKLTLIYGFNRPMSCKILLCCLKKKKNNNNNRKRKYHSIRFRRCKLQVCCVYRYVLMFTDTF